MAVRRVVLRRIFFCPSGRGAIPERWACGDHHLPMSCESWADMHDRRGFFPGYTGIGHSHPLDMNSKSRFVN